MNQVQKYVGELKVVLDQLVAEPIQSTIDLLHQARLEGRQIFTRMMKDMRMYLLNNWQTWCKQMMS